MYEYVQRSRFCVSNCGLSVKVKSLIDRAPVSTIHIRENRSVRYGHIHVHSNSCTYSKRLSDRDEEWGGGEQIADTSWGHKEWQQRESENRIGCTNYEHKTVYVVLGCEVRFFNLFSCFESQHLTLDRHIPYAFSRRSTFLGGWPLTISTVVSVLQALHKYVYS